LINKHNKLYVRVTPREILYGKTYYLVELDRNKVVGCVGIKPKYGGWCEICHLCVHPDVRGESLGTRLVGWAVDDAPRDKLYCTIRHDNWPSIVTISKLGFEIKGKYRSRDHWVLILTKLRGKDGQEKVGNIGRSL